MPSSGKRLEGAHRALRQPVRIPGFGRVQALAGGVDHREQIDHRDAQFQRVFRLAQQLVQRQTFDARHRGNRRAPWQLMHEHRPDQIVGGQRVLAHQPARKRIVAHTTGTVVGVGHDGLLKSKKRVGRAIGTALSGVAPRPARTDAPHTQPLAMRHLETAHWPRCLTTTVAAKDANVLTDRAVHATDERRASKSPATRWQASGGRRWTAHKSTPASSGGMRCDAVSQRCNA